MVIQRLDVSIGSEPVTLRLSCRTDRDSDRGTTHPVTIAPDWTVTTPHDLEAERIAASFGAWTSCVDLVDRVIPAARHALRLLTRSVRPPVQVLPAGGWGSEVPIACCRRQRYIDVHGAARHVRSVEHIACKFDVHEWQLTELLRELSRLVGPWTSPPADSWHPGIQLVREVDGLDQLWRAGLHPDDLPGLAASASAIDEPLPVTYYLGVAFSGVDRDWLSRMIVHRPHAEAAAWLAWVPRGGRVERRDEWGTWLELGLTPHEIDSVDRAGVPTGAASAIAAVTSIPITDAAHDLAAWAKVGCLPSPEHFMALEHFGIFDYRPSGRGLTKLLADVKPYWIEPDTTELAIMLAIAGTRPNVVSLVSRGVRHVTDLLNLAHHETEIF